MPTSGSLKEAVQGVRSKPRKGVRLSGPPARPEIASKPGLRVPERPSRLWVPPMVERELVEQRKEYEGQMLHMLSMKHKMDEFNKLFREVLNDPYVQLVKAEEKIEAGHALRPGYWHVIRHNPGAPPSIMVIEGDDGEYVEPSYRLFQKMKECDLWDSRTIRDRNKKLAQLEEAERKQKETERESRQEEVLERYLAATRTQVSMQGRWSQNVAGRRGR